MKMRNEEDSTDKSSTPFPSDKEIMEPLDFSTKRVKSPVPIWAKGIPNTPDSASYLTHFDQSPTHFNLSPSHSRLSSTSESLSATVRAGDQPYCDSLPSSPDTVSPVPPLIPFARAPMNTSLSISPTVRVNKNSLSIERVRSRYSQPNLLARSPAPAENMFSVHSNGEINLSTPKASIKRSPPPESFPQTSPQNSFTGNQYLNYCEGEPSTDDKEYNNNNISSVNKNIINGSLFQNGSPSSSSLLLPGLTSALSLQALQTHPSLMYFQQNNPFFLSTLCNLINQNVSDVQPTTSSLPPHNAKPSLPQEHPISLLAPHMSIPPIVPPLLPIGHNSYSHDLNEDLQLRAAMLSKEQVGHKRRRKSSQNSKEKKSDDKSRASREENESCKDKMEEGDSNRTSSEEGDSSRTHRDDGSSSSEEDKKFKSDSSKETIKDEAYWERRRKNNEAAKRSRDARRAKDEATKLRKTILEAENHQLRMELQHIKEHLLALKAMKIFPKRNPHQQAQVPQF